MRTAQTLTKLEPWVLGVALLLPTVVTLAYFRLAASAPEVVQQLVYAGGKAIQFGLPVVWVLGVLGQRPRFCWGDRNSLLLGSLFGVAVMLATWFGYEWLAGTEAFARALEPIRQKVAGLGIASPWRFVMLGLFYALGHSLLEEYYWRWFVYGRLRGVIGEVAALVVSALGFMLHHVLVLGTYFSDSPLVTAALSLSIFVGGVFWAWLYRRSGSLVGPWIGHLLVDAGIFAVGYRMLFSV